MKNAFRSLLVLAALFVSLVALAHVVDSPPPARAGVASAAASVVPSAPPPVVAPAPAPPAPPWQAPVQLVDYLEHAMLAFSPPAKQAGPATHHRAIAKDLADLASWPGEPRMFADDPHGAHGALVIASIGFLESRYRDYVDEGKCNDLAWRATKEGQKLLTLGDCDGGRAVGFVQVQFPATGILLRGDGGWHDAAYDQPDDNERATVYKADALADRKVLILVALAMARQSIKRGAGLAQYCGGEHAAAKGKERLETATTYWTRHPFAL